MLERQRHAAPSSNELGVVVNASDEHVRTVGAVGSVGPVESWLAGDVVCEHVHAPRWLHLSAPGTRARTCKFIRNRLQKMLRRLRAVAVVTSNSSTKRHGMSIAYAHTRAVDGSDGHRARVGLSVSRAERVKNR